MNIASVPELRWRIPGRSATLTNLRSFGGWVFVSSAPPLAIVFAFAPDLLALWLGVGYAEQATTALRIIALGVLMNALAHPLFISLYAMNRRHRRPVRPQPRRQALDF